MRDHPSLLWIAGDWISAGLPDLTGRYGRDHFESPLAIC